MQLAFTRDIALIEPTIHHRYHAYATLQSNTRHFAETNQFCKKNGPSFVMIMMTFFRHEDDGKYIPKYIYRIEVQIFKMKSVGASRLQQTWVGDEVAKVKCQDD